MKLKTITLIMCCIMNASTGFAEDTFSVRQKVILQLYEKEEYERVIEEISLIYKDEKNISPHLEEMFLDSLSRLYKCGAILKYAEKIGDENRMSSWSLATVVWAACRQDNFDLAEQYLDDIVVKPNDTDELKSVVHIYRAYIHANDKNYEKAIKEMLIAHGIEPLDIPNECILARYYLDVGNQDQAVERIKKITQMEKIYVQYHLLYLSVFLAREEFVPLHCEEGFIETYLFSARVLFKAAGFSNEPKSTMDQETEHCLWSLIFDTGAAIYDANMKASNQRQAYSILKVFKEIGGQGFNFYITVVELELMRGREYNSILVPFMSTLKLYLRMTEESKKTAFNEVRRLLEGYIDSNPRYIDALNITWFYNTGEWLCDDAFSDDPVQKGGKLDKEHYEKKRENEEGKGGGKEFIGVDGLVGAQTNTRSE